jgi:hypothetical protein
VGPFFGRERLHRLYDTLCNASAIRLSKQYNQDAMMPLMTPPSKSSVGRDQQVLLVLGLLPQVLIGQSFFSGTPNIGNLMPYRAQVLYAHPWNVLVYQYLHVVVSAKGVTCSSAKEAA